MRERERGKDLLFIFFLIVLVCILRHDSQDEEVLHLFSQSEMIISRHLNSRCGSLKLLRGVSSHAGGSGGVVGVASPTSSSAGGSRGSSAPSVPTFPDVTVLIPPPVLKERLLSPQHQQQIQKRKEDETRNKDEPLPQSYLTLLQRDVWGLVGLDGEGELGLRRMFSSGGDNKMMRGVAVKIAQSINDSRNRSSNEEQRQQHPFMATAGGLFFGSDLDVVTPGALVLLFERALMKKIVSKSSLSCLSVARAVVKTCGGYEIHRTVGDEENSELDHQGNKLATLTGDLLVISLIKDVVAGTRSNKVLELTMESLSEFSLGEVAGRRVFCPSNNSSVKFVGGSDLAESWVVARGLESVGVLTNANAEALTWLREIGLGLGTLWKVHYDFVQLLQSEETNNKKRLFLENRGEMVEYVRKVGGEVRRGLERGIQKGFVLVSDDVEGCGGAIGAVRALVDQWEGDILTEAASTGGGVYV